MAQKIFFLLKTSLTTIPVILIDKSSQLSNSSIWNKLKSISPDHAEDIKKILIDKDLTLEEKIEFLKLKIDYALKNLKGKKT